MKSWLFSNFALLRTPSIPIKSPLNHHEITINHDKLPVFSCAMALLVPVWRCAPRVEVKEAVATTMPEAMAG
jgi:hypothetical protein